MAVEVFTPRGLKGREASDCKPVLDLFLLVLLLVLVLAFRVFGAFRG
jgi:hypothetical protein